MVKLMCSLAVSLLCLLHATLVVGGPTPRADSSSSRPCPERCVARAQRGTITGHAATSSDGGACCEWLGIPYAAAPVGQLRFAPPAKLTTKGDFVASKYGPDCPQNPAKLFAYPHATPQYSSVFSNFASTTVTNHTQSEDCLSLNVWSSGTTGEPKPVIVFIHGGRHTSGTSNTPFYRGANLASAQSLVVVTFNFRMNIFGFPGAPEGTQNVGLLDHYAAVSWVRDNIAAFGGDPRRITIAGQSSGAASVANWAYAFRDDPVVAGTISHSGNQFSFPTNTLAQAAANWHTVASLVGCGNSSASLACMRSPSISFQSILDATRQVPSIPGNSPARSQPPVQATQDGRTFFTNAQYVQLAASGQLARLPYLQLHNDHESGFYRISALAQGNTLSECQWSQFEAQTFVCPMTAEALYRNRQAVPTFRARYMADWANTRLYEDPTSGAYHGVELEVLTGNSGLTTGIAPVADQDKLTLAMQKAWGAFARDPAQGLGREVGWPGTTSNRGSLQGKSLIRIGTGTTSTIEFVDPGMYDGVCAGMGLDFWDSDLPRGTGPSPSC